MTAETEWRVANVVDSESATGAAAAHPIHDVRHTTLLIQQGESLVYVRDQMGHRSIQVTVDVYGHLGRGRIAPPSTGSTTWRPRHQTTLRNQ